MKNKNIPFNESIEYINRIYKFDSLSNILNHLINVKKKLKESKYPYVRNFINRLKGHSDAINLLDVLLFSMMYKVRITWKKEYCYLNIWFSLAVNDSSLNVNELVTDNFTIKMISEGNSRFNVEHLYNPIYQISKTFFYDTSFSSDNYLKKHPIGFVKKPRITNEKFASMALDGAVSLITTYDIDAIVGMVDKKSLCNSIRGSFNLNFTALKNAFTKLLLTKRYLFYHKNSVYNIKNCSFIYLGFFSLKLGDLNLFIISTKSDTTQDKYDKLYSIFKSFKSYDSTKVDDKRVFCAKQIVVNEPDKKITGIITEENIHCFFTYLYDSCKRKPIFFVEVLGNKSKTQSSHYLLLLKELQAQLCIENLPFLKIDLCIEKSSKEPFLTCASEVILNKLGYKFTHKILFSNLIGNCHHNNLTKKKEQYIYTNSFIDKINFYSSIEDITKKCRNNTFLPEVSMAFLDMSLLTVCSKKLNKVEKKRIDFRNMINNFSVVPISYRQEVRISPVFFLEIINTIDSSYLEAFNFIPVQRVNDILKSITTSYLIQFVPPKTDFDLFRFILYEFCYNNIFLKGEQDTRRR